jgi:hypothetical protein
MAVVVIVIVLALMAFHEDPLVRVIFNWVHHQKSLNDNGF